MCLLSMDLPSRLADRLASGDLDVALIPSVEYFRGAGLGYEVLPGFAIAARGPVRSVKLFSRVPFGQIDAWRSTPARGRARRWPGSGSTPSMACGRAGSSSLPMGVPVEESTADAVLLIGDRAMTVARRPVSRRCRPGRGVERLTGLPFVFASGWCGGGRPGRPARRPWRGAGPRGWRTPPSSRPSTGRRLGLDVATCFDYLTRVLSYDLGEPELAGLRRFAQMAAASGPGPGRSGPCLPPSPRSCSAPLTASG